MKTKKIELKNEIKNLNKVIAMKCLDCCNCQPKEVIRCQIAGCPLWNQRPKELRGLYTYVKELRKENIGFYEANERKIFP